MRLRGDEELGESVLAGDADVAADPAEEDVIDDDGFAHEDGDDFAMVPSAPIPARAGLIRTATRGSVDASALFLLAMLVLVVLTFGIYATARTTETVNAAHALVESISTTYWSGSVSEELAITERKLARDAETERSIAATLSTLLARVNALAAELGVAVRRR